MTGNNYSQRREPFSNVDEWETEAGTRIEVGQDVLVKPQYVSQRLPAVVDRIYWDPQGLPGGKFDHRGEKVSRTDPAELDDPDVDPVGYENPSEYDCILKAQFRFDVPEDHEYSHMDGKTRRLEAFNLDFCIGTDPEIRRDRGNCNATRE